MSPSLLDFLRHIAHECQFIINVSKDKTLDDLLNDELLSKGIVRGLEIIGEATKKLPPDIKDKYIQIDWDSMAGMRDVLIHNYFGIDYEIVWQTVKADIPDLHHEIERIIRDVESKINNSEFP